MRRAPRAAWLCALVAALSAFAWSLIIPPFHVVDEVSHFAYAQYLAETGELPRLSDDLRYSDEQQQALHLTDFYLVVGDARSRPPATAAIERGLDELGERGFKRVSTGNAQSATNNPPLYYALLAPVYWATSGLGFMERLWAMRLVSVLLAAATAFACVLFVREALPSRAWAWTVGGLAVALHPLFGSVGAGVQSDALLVFAGALTFYAMARILRRGLDVRGGALLGTAVAIGTLSKPLYVGLLPGVALCLLAALWRAGRASGAAPAPTPAVFPRPGAWRGAGLAVAIPAVAVGIYVLGALTWWDRPLYGAGSGDATSAPVIAGPASFNLGEYLSYTWQLYAPRLPFMTEMFAIDPMPNLWAHGWVGRFGWLDTLWPTWVYQLGAAALAALIVAAAVVVGRRVARAGLGVRWVELVVYAVATGGLLLLIAAAGYQAREGGSPSFEQARYLLPLLPLYSAVVALAARAGGRRWGLPLGALLIVAAFGHGLLAQLLAVARYYG